MTKAVIAIAVVTALAFWLELSALLYSYLTALPLADARPWTLLEQWKHYGSDQRVLSLIGGSLFLPLLVFSGIGAAIAQAMKTERKQYGDARWATLREIAKAGLLKKHGRIIIGRSGRHLLKVSGVVHVLLAAKTGSGKGQGFVIPNLLHWPDSVVTLDIKRENFTATAGFRSKYGKIFYFDPAPRDYKGHRWNPFYYVSDDANFRIDDIQKIAHMLCPDPPSGHNFWESGARTLFLTCALYLFETNGPESTTGPIHKVTLGAVVRLLHSYGGAHAFFEAELQRLQGTMFALSARCAELMSAFISTAEKTRDGFVQTLQTALELYVNPITDAATSGNDFDLRKLREERMTVFVEITPDNLERMGPLICLFFQQVLDLNTRVLPIHDKKLRYQLFIPMDEMTSPGRIPALARGISYVRGYGIQIATIVQSIAQLRATYTPEVARNYVANHGVKIAFSTNEFNDARELSESLGQTTIKTESETKRDGKPSKSTSKAPRALMLPQEIRDLGETDQIIFTDQAPPIRCKKIVVRNDPAFRDRLNLPVPKIPTIPLPPERVAFVPPPQKEEPHEAVRQPKIRRKPVPKRSGPTDEEIATLAAQLVLEDQKAADA